MASISELKFLTTLSFSKEVARAILLRYEKRTGGEVIQRRAYALYTMADKYMEMFCRDIKSTDKNLIRIAKTVKDMTLNGLEDGKSFQPQLSLVIGLLADREDEIIEYGAKESKLNCVKSMLDSAKKCSEYFSSRAWRYEFEEMGAKLVDTFNMEFA